MKVLISAAETSSDNHGAELLKSLSKNRRVEAFGLGGEKLRRAGLRVLYPAEKLLAMGFTEILSRLPDIRRAMNLLVEEAKKEKPDVAILIDYPDFHFRLSKKLKKLGIPLVYYIPPKVWAWRRNRVRVLEERFDRILSILPFEVPFYEKHRIPVRYVGNPLLDELPLGTTQAQAREALGIPLEDKVLLLMPGSRPAEIQFHFKKLIASAQRIQEKLGSNLRVLIALPPHVNLPPHAGNLPPNFEVVFGKSHECMLAADFAAIKSGTSTLEAAMLGCPHVVVFDASWLTSVIYIHMIDYFGPVALSNLVLGPDRPFAFEELIGEEFTEENLTRGLLALVQDPQRISDVKRALRQVHRQMQVSSSPSEIAAEEVWKTFEESRHLAPPNRVGFREKLVSTLWSSVNFLMRLFGKTLLRPRTLGSQVISVGNIQAGGTGKTPIVAKIARQAVDQGKTVCILTRGYRSQWEKQGGVISPGEMAPDPEKCGDEAALLHELVPEAWIGVGSKRTHQWEKIRRRTKIDVVILDDGFQNWKIRKDVELVAVTSDGRGSPYFRDFQGSLRYADLLVWTKGNKPPASREKPLVHVDLSLPRTESPCAVWAVAGVADSEAVRQSIRKAGYEIRRFFAFSDHADYRPGTIRDLAEGARLDGCKIALTGKDWVKWRKHLKPNEAILLEPELEFLSGQDLWEKLLWKKSAPSS